MKIKIVKVKEVKTPERATKGSAGLDFFVPDSFPGKHYLAPSQSTTFESGIHVKIPKNHVLVAMNKSSVATKKGFQVGACVIDEDYQGEIEIHLTNVGDEIRTLEPGEKIIQMVLLPVKYPTVEEKESLNELYPETSERGAGGFGSTGKD